MTSSNGYRVIKSPCCGTNFASPSYMSINHSCWEYWTDGRAVKSLAPQDGGLLKCVCGNSFLYRQAESGSIIYNPPPPPPEGWESEEVWSGFLQRGQSRKDYLLAKYDFRPESEREQERLAKPPDELIVQDEELEALFASGCSNTDVLIVARRRYWRHLNDEYREVYRKHVGSDLEKYPEYKPSKLQQENMLNLLDLLSKQLTPDYLEIAELYRELSDFKNALSILATKYKENDDQQATADKIANLIVYKQNQPQIVDMYL